MNMKERMAGALLLCAIAPLAFLGYLIICVVGLFGPTARVRAGVRALDHFVNASVFNGYAWESVSAHAWRAQDKWWAKIVIWLTHCFQPDHCRRAHNREKPLMKVVMERRLYEQTVGKTKVVAEQVETVVETEVGK